MKFLKDLHKAYYMPISLPIWKWIIVYISWAIAVVGYISTMFITLWMLIVGIVFQILGCYLPYIWNSKRLKT